AGTVIERREYEPYGRQLAPAVQEDGPAYTGHVSDAVTGLSYMQQRYYDPFLGRFLSVDPVTADGSTGANFNRYWYANNNPLKFKDVDGRQACFGALCDEYHRAKCEVTCTQAGRGGRKPPRSGRRTSPNDVRTT